VQVAKYMTRCLSYAIDNKVYADVQKDHLDIIAKASREFDPETPVSKHFFTKIFDDAISARCVKCFTPSVRGSRFGKCPGGCWSLGHRLSSVG
jgi:hypothetical protein